MKKTIIIGMCMFVLIVSTVSAVEYMQASDCNNENLNTAENIGGTARAAAMLWLYGAIPDNDVGRGIVSELATAYVNAKAEGIGPAKACLRIDKEKYNTVKADMIMNSNVPITTIGDNAQGSRASTTVTQPLPLAYCLGPSDASDYTHQGTVTYFDSTDTTHTGPQHVADSCGADHQTLTKYYCNGPTLTPASYTCGGTGGHGYYGCEEGRCTRDVGIDQSNPILQAFITPSFTKSSTPTIRFWLWNYLGLGNTITGVNYDVDFDNNNVIHISKDLSTSPLSPNAYRLLGPTNAQVGTPYQNSEPNSYQIKVVLTSISINGDSLNPIELLNSQYDTDLSNDNRHASVSVTDSS